MIQRFTSSGLVWPTILTIVGLAVLVTLGNWQWSRMQWKQGLIDQIAERTTSSPIGFTQARVKYGFGYDDAEYVRVSVTGRLDRNRARWVYANGPEGSGWHVYAPLLTKLSGFSGVNDLAKSSGPFVVWVNLGYVPDRERSAVTRDLSGVVDGHVVTGLLRRPEKVSWFTSLMVPENDPQRNIYYTRSLRDFHTHTFDQRIKKTADVVPAPYFIDAERSGDGWPRGGTTNLKLTNKHLGYALTWWGLALTLIGVYAAFAAQRLGQRREPDASKTDAGAAS